MYKKVLVPLDGSKLAEFALPHVTNLAKEGSIGKVILLQVVEMEIPIAYTTADDYSVGQSYDFQAIWNDQLDKSRTYLADLKARLSSKGIKVQTVLIEGGRTAQAITECAEKHGVDLIVIATHGYTGMKRLLLGSVAFRVLHESSVPVLLIRPESCS